jgi:lipoprotein-releasing system permease protein
MYKLFLCLRYLRKRRIAFFAVAAVCLCVAMVLIVRSVMGGFLQMVKDRSRGMLGDLVVENKSLQGFSHYDEFIHDLKTQMPDQIFEATPVIISYGVLRWPISKITKPAEIVGIKLEETYRVNDFKNGLFYEKYYPGTTSFNEQKMPYCGLDPARIGLARKLAQEGLPDYVDKAFDADGPGRWILPEPYQSAWDQWQASATPEQKAKLKDLGELTRDFVGNYREVPRSEISSFDDLGPTLSGKAFPGAILGTDIFAERKSDGTYERFVSRGQEVQLTFVPFSPGGTIQDATGMPSKVFRYSDDVRTGVYDIDSMSVYIDFDMLQKILRMDEQTLTEEAGGGKLPPRTTQVQIKLKPGVAAMAARDKVEKIWSSIYDKHIGSEMHPDLLGSVKIKTWEQKQEHFIEAVQKEQALVTILFGIVSLVAAVLVGCILYMIVNQKTRDIGIIKSVGATSLGIWQIFVAFGAAIGLVGGFLGCILGTVFVWYINDIQAMLTRFDKNLQVWNPEVYAFDRIPNHVDPLTVVVIFFSAIVLSMLGSLIAAWRAARVWPVEALRYE